MTWYIRAYSGTTNLGDAIQTIALARLLPGEVKCVEFSRPIPSEYRLVVNGWLGHNDVPQGKSRALFAGIHLREASNQREQFLRWITQSAQGTVGARDPITREVLRGRAIGTEFCGCAALTFTRYNGPRAGELHIDDESPGCLTNRIPRGMLWEHQWNEASHLLERIRTAACVHTCRLHVALPCLAMGTPVRYHDPTPIDKYGFDLGPRFSIFWEMGMSRHQMNGEPAIDVTAWSEIYKGFLKKVIAHDLQEKDLARLPFSEHVN